MQAATFGTRADKPLGFLARSSSFEKKKKKRKFLEIFGYEIKGLTKAPTRPVVQR
jgi:hypothetical protein